VSGIIQSECAYCERRVSFAVDGTPLSVLINSDYHYSEGNHDVSVSCLAKPLLPDPNGGDFLVCSGATPDEPPYEQVVPIVVDHTFPSLETVGIACENRSPIK
jgi:hypothetical protein